MHVCQLLYACASLHANWQKDREEVMALLKFSKRVTQLSSSSPTATGVPTVTAVLCLLTHKEQGCGQSDRALSMLACKINSERDVDGDQLPNLILTNQEARAHHQVAVSKKCSKVSKL